MTTKKQYYENLKITPKSYDVYELLEEFKYKDITIPKGYCTNGADIPRIFWSIWPPNRSDYLPAVVVHDYLCDKKEYSKADKYFKEILQILEINKVTVFFFSKATKLYHKVRYNILKIR